MTPPVFHSDPRATLKAAGIRYGHTLKPSKANTRKKRLKKQRRILKSIALWHESEMAYLRSRCEGKIYSQDATIRFQNCEITKLPMLVMESEGRSVVSVLGGGFHNGPNIPERLLK